LIYIIGIYYFAGGRHDRQSQDFHAWPQPGGAFAQEFRLPGREVRVSRVGRGVLLEPMEKITRADVEAVFHRIDQLGGGQPFLAEGRPEQPAMPPGPSFDE
jgi:antitoxin VapB